MLTYSKIVFQVRIFNILSQKRRAFIQLNQSIIGSGSFKVGKGTGSTIFILWVKLMFRKANDANDANDRQL